MSKFFSRALVLLVALFLAVTVPVGIAIAANSENSAERSAGLIESRDSAVLLRFQHGHFDPARVQPPLPPGLLAEQREPEGPAYYLVQFEGPIRQHWRDELEASGAEIMDYVPDFAYIVRMDRQAFRTTVNVSGVRWTGIYEPGFRLSHELAVEARDSLPGTDASHDVLIVRAFQGEPLNDVAAQLTAAGVRVLDRFEDTGGGAIFRVQATSSDYFAMAEIMAVAWIERELEPAFSNSVARSNTILRKDSVESVLSLYGSGQIIGIGDSGLDTGDPATVHADFAGRFVGGTWGSGTCGSLADSNSHGTHVAGSAAGSGVLSGADIPNQNYAGSHAGTAPEASLYIWNFCDNFSGLPGAPYADYYAVKYEFSPQLRVSNNSWGFTTGQGGYNTFTRETDRFVRDNLDMVLVFAAGNAGVDSNSDGVVNPGSVNMPSTAKNIITVGASENVRATGGYNPGGPCSTWGTCWPADYPANPINSDGLSDDAAGIAAFSGRGPTLSNRIKPDLVAPGTNIVSTRNYSAGTGWGVFNADYLYSGGTSMASPLVAGAAAVVREFYATFHALPSPSTALVKATLVNGAVDLTPGQYGTGATQEVLRRPDRSQGFGRVNLEDSLIFDGGRALYFHEHAGLNTADTFTTTITTQAGGAPFRASLVWTDFQGTEASNGALVNDLDLEVLAPGGVLHRGNELHTSGAADRDNNVEVVELASASGTYEITVRGFNVPQGPQPFALVISYEQAVSFVLQSGEDTVSACGGVDATVNIDALSFSGFNDVVSFSTSGLPAGASASFSPSSLVPDDPAVSSVLTLSDTGLVSPGAYPFTVLGDSSGPNFPAESVSLPLTLQVSSGLPAAPVLLAPANGAILASPTPTLQWGAVSGALEYLVEVSDSTSFSSPVYSASVTGTSHAVGSALPIDEPLYWRVSAINACGAGSVSVMASFTISGPVCRSPALAIPDGVPAGINDSLTLTGAGNLADMQVYLRASHTWVGDLVFTLTSPSGTAVTLINRPGVGAGSTFGCGNNDIDVTLNDAASNSVQTACSPTPPAIGGVLTPAQPLSVLAGEPMAGEWTLNVADFVTPDPGVLEEWCLIPADAAQPIIELEPDSVAAAVGVDLTKTVPVAVGNVGTAALDWQFTATGLFGEIGLRRVQGEASRPDIPAFGTIDSIGLSLAEPGSGPERSVPYAAASPRSGLSLTHSNSQTVTAALTPACGSAGFTSQNAYLRTFTLTDFGINDAFAVEAVTFGVEQSTASSTPITVNLYSLVGAFQYANMTLIGSSIQNLPSQSLTLVTVPISGQVPAGGTLVVEVLAPDQSGVAAFRAGANSDGETAPSYIAAPGCGINEPTAMASIGFPDTHLVMTVSGRLPLACTAPDDIAWLALAPGSGTAAAGSQQTVTLILDASGLSPGAYTDQLCVQSNDPVNPLLALPVEMTVVDTYAVGGTVSGLAGSGLVLQNNGADDLSVTADGVFNFVTPVADGASYAVSVLGQPAGQVCTVSNGTGTIAGAAVSDVGVSCVTATGDQALQVGSVNMAAIAGSGLRASAGPMSVSFPVVFSEPPVVIVMPGNEGVEARSVRIRNVTSSGFELLPVTAPPGDGDGPPMTVHYIAAVPGDYPLPIVGGGTGPRVQVGRWDTTTIQYNPEAFPPNVLPEDNSGNPGSACSQAPTPGWDGQSFPGTDFATPPVLLASVQSWNNEGVNLNGELEGPSAPFMNVALQNIGISGFDGAIELSEVRRNVPCAGLVGAETIGYVAIEDNVDVLLEPSGGGSPITLVTGIGIAHRGEANDPPTWSASHCRDNDLSVTGSFVEANLRGFAALRSRAEADGGWLRRCSVSSPSSGTLRLALRIDEDNHFDAERRQTPAPTTTGEIRDEPVSMAVFGGDFVTTPVSLAWMKVEPLSASRVRVDWATETEVGHVGFELQARGRDGRWQPVGEMIPGRGFGELGGDDYSIELALPSSAIELRLVDVDQFGQRRLHAPVAIGSEQGARSQIELTDWAAINARNAQFPITARQASGGTMAVARVFEAGIQRLTHSELLAAGVDLSGQTAALVAVWSGGVPQARYVGGPEVWAEDSYVEWLGEVSDSRYHATRAYRIGVDAAAAVAVPTGQPALAGSGPRIERHALRFERNRRYSPTSPAEDPWFDARLSTAGNPVQIQREFELGPRAPGSALLEVDVWGGLDYPGETPDHHVELWLNGQRIASHRFDGLVAERIVVELEDQWLAENNELIIRLPGDTGYPADVVQFDGFTVTLPRQSAFHDGRGQGADAVSGQGDRVFHSRFETSQTGFLIDQAPTGAVVWYESPDLGLVRLVHDEGALWLSEDVSAWTGTGPGHFVQPQVEMAVAAAEPEGADYLIISHPQFVEHLQPLIALQLARGLSVAVARTDEIYAAFGHDEPIPEAIAAFVAAQATARYVLLVGGDHVDYRGYLGNEAVSFIPTFYRQADAIVRHAPDELEFVDRNGDGLPDAALGRLPVRSVEELQRLLTAIVELDQAGPAERLLIASGGSGGAHERFGHDARVLGSISADISSLSYAAVDELGTESARQRVRDALAGEADWLSYLGHSAPDRWGFEPLLLRSQLASIVREAPPAIISQWGCWNNWFVSPTQNSMIHGLMLGDQVKAATVLGSVSLAEDASHFALAVRFYSLRASGGLHGQPGAVNTLGEALLHAKRDLVQNAPGHQSAARSVVLFGDPAQPLR